ncbi:MAG: hypothetical protein COW42_16090 [Deltaproteobacteria bacterium CG17_big_fil_post_rev_8_21_14_2_50_63_7]|nr:MAG: hypothetical protein COW42_16090 [Deltaproteobacteria bacterium CG17_big_fil_post_rev_8_21_14_2_50_63_7]
MKRWEAGKARDTDALRVALVLDPLKEETDIERLCALGPNSLRALRLKKTSYERLDAPLGHLFREATLDALEHLVLDQLTLLRGAELLSEFANHRTFPALQKLEILATNIGGRRDLGDAVLTALHSKFALDKVRVLHLYLTSIRARGLEGLCRSGALFLECLVLDGERVELDGARALATCATLSGLRHLTLRRAHLDDGGIELLTNAEFWPALETLSLAGDRAIRLGTAAARRVCETPSHRLQVLDLASSDVDGDAARQLAHAPLAAMGTLILSGNSLGREGLVPLLESTWLEHVEVLDLSGTGMDDELVQRLVSRSMKRLKALNLAGSALTHLGLTALMRTHQMPLLSELSLASCRLEGEALEALQADGLPSLARLELSFNPLGDDGAQRLAAAPRCEHLRAISLESTHISNSGIAALQASRYTCGRFGGLPGHILAATHEPWMWSRIRS